MKKYEKYKDSGIEWIGEIPEDWNTVRLKYRGESIIGIIYSPSDVTTEDNGTLVLRSSNIQDGKLSFDDCVYVAKEVQEKHLTKEGDILLCARNGSAHLVGKSAFIPKEWEGVSFGAFMSIVRTDLGKFLFYFFNSQIFKAQTGLFSTSTINQLTADTLNNMSITIPATEEDQTAIAIYLDRKTAEIDELIADKKRLLELYEEEKTAIINQTVTKGINPNTPMKDSGIEWLGEIPEHWKVKRLKYVANSYPSNVDKKSKEGENEVLLCNYVDVYKNDFITSEIQFMKATASDSQIEKFKLKKGDVIATKDSESPDDIAISALVREDFENVICGYHLNFIRPIHIFGDFVFRFFQSEYTKGYFFNAANGVTRYGIGTEKFSNFVVCVPPFEEQQRIVRHIETECTRIDSKIITTNNLIDLLTEYRTALISEVVTGKIKVTE